MVMMYQFVYFKIQEEFKIQMQINEILALHQNDQNLKKDEFLKLKEDFHPCTWKLKFVYFSKGSNLYM